MAPPAYPCPACGDVVFGEPPGSYEICPICGWEDDAVQLANPTSGGGANRESLVAVQLAARAREDVPGATRDPSWRPVSDEEVAWHLSECEAAGSPWPNRATDIYYWRFPFERVYAVLDWYDGPIAGVADYKGSPHRFVRRWDTERDDWAEHFELEPVSERVLVLERERWSLWLRWLDAFDDGRTDASTHPVLPEDRSADETITRELARVRSADESARAHGTFRGDLRRCADARVRWRPMGPAGREVGEE